MCQKMPPQSAKSLHYSLSRQNSFFFNTNIVGTLVWEFIPEFDFFLSPRPVEIVGDVDDPGEDEAEEEDEDDRPETGRHLGQP